MIRETRAFLISVLRYRWPEWQRPLMTSPVMVRVREEVVQEEEEEEEYEEEDGEEFESDEEECVLQDDEFEEAESFIEEEEVEEEEVVQPPPPPPVPETIENGNAVKTPIKSLTPKKIRTPLRSIQNL